MLQHLGGRVAGSWTRLREDGRGLFVRGRVSDATLAGRLALKPIAQEGLSGLSIGFIARDWSPRVGRGRELREIEPREVSAVSAPVLPAARFAALINVGGIRMAA